LTASLLNVGSAGIGVFAQSGGNANVGYLSIAPGGTYVRSGGSLQISTSIYSQGTVDFTGAPVSFAAPAITNFGAGTLINSSAATITAGANSLLIFPPGFDPVTQLAGMNSGGIIHIAGSTLTIAASQQ